MTDEERPVFVCSLDEPLTDRHVREDPYDPPDADKRFDWGLDRLVAEQRR